MIYPSSKLIIADNTGAKLVSCIQVLKRGERKFGRLGDVLVISIKQASPRGVVKKKEVHHAVIVRQRKPYRRKDGSTVRFDDNAAVIINPDNTPKGTRIFGPIARELRETGYSKIISMAQEVI